MPTVPKIRIAKTARADLLQIFRYTAATFGSVQADAYYEGLWRIFTLLGDCPHIGKRTDWPKKSMRRFVYEAHVIFYRPLEAGVEIVKILPA